MSDNASFSFSGFRESDLDGINKYSLEHYNITVLVYLSINRIQNEVFSTRGINTGVTELKESSIDFKIENQVAFSIPYNEVEQCATVKNDVSVQLHQPDDFVDDNVLFLFLFILATFFI